MKNSRTILLLAIAIVLLLTGVFLLIFKARKSSSVVVIAPKNRSAPDGSPSPKPVPPRDPLAPQDSFDTQAGRSTNAKRDPDHPARVYMTPGDNAVALGRKLQEYDESRQERTTGLGLETRLETVAVGQFPKFVTSITADPSGKLWVGSESQGIWRYDPSEEPDHQWRQFTPGEGLGEYQVYSVACDQQGRIWAGLLNRGVSVYNGQRWRTYDVLRGPLGERVFKIAVCPTDGNVWIATNAGVTRYLPKDNQWIEFTPDGTVPFNHIQAIAFDPQGNVYLGTQFDGMAMANAADGYSTWHTFRGSDTVPTMPSGPGLPSNLINDVLVSHNGTIFAATDQGLARSVDRGASWSFVRGQDWADKVRGFIGGPPPEWAEQGKALLAEDYCTCLAEDRAGILWIGHRAQGCEALDPKTDRIVYSRRGQLYPDHRDGAQIYDFVSALFAPAGRPVVIGRYPGAPVAADRNFDTLPIPAAPATRPATSQPVVPLPTTLHPITLADMNRMLIDLSHIPPANPTESVWAIGLDEDWRTQGDWIGRYGRYSAYPCACCYPELIWNPGPIPIGYHPFIDPAFEGRDTLRHWVHWQYTTNPSSLELQPIYLDSRVAMHLTKRAVNRRQSEWDDHGEVYPLTMQGPDVLCAITVPAGDFRLSLYDFNKNGYSGLDRFRDFKVSLWGHSTDASSSPPGQGDMGRLLARSRIHQFSGTGFYDRFLLHGPGIYTFRVERNYSYDTILAGVFLDLMDELPPPYFCDLNQWQTQKEQRQQQRQQELRRWADPAERSTDATPAKDEAQAADRLWEELQRACLRNPTWAATGARLYFRDLALWYGFASLKAKGAAKDQITRRTATCYYQIDLYSLWEDCLKQLKQESAREIEQSLRWDHVTDSYRGMEFRLIRQQVDRSTTGSIR